MVAYRSWLSRLGYVLVRGGYVSVDWIRLLAPVVWCRTYRVAGYFRLWWLCKWTDQIRPKLPAIESGGARKDLNVINQWWSRREKTILNVLKRSKPLYYGGKIHLRHWSAEDGVVHYIGFITWTMKWSLVMCLLQSWVVLVWNNKITSRCIYSVFVTPDCCFFFFFEVKRMHYERRPVAHQSVISELSVSMTKGTSEGLSSLFLDLISFWWCLHLILRYGEVCIFKRRCFWWLLRTHGKGSESSS